MLWRRRDPQAQASGKAEEGQGEDARVRLGADPAGSLYRRAADGRGIGPGAKPSADLSPRLYWGGLALVLAVATAFRFWDLAAAPLWMDEAFTLLAARMPVRALLFDGVDIHPPLFYLIEKAWLALSGGGAAELRVPAALFGVAGVGLLGLMVADLVSRSAGLIAAAFLAVSTSHIYLSQDARMYTLMVALLTLASWGAIGIASRGGRLRYVALYVIGGGIGVYSHPFAAVFLILLNLGYLGYWLVARREREARGMIGRLVVANLAVLVLALPWLALMVTLIRGGIA